MLIHRSMLTPYQLPLKRNWRSHQGQFAERRGWLISLDAGDYHGVGDCAPLPSAGTESAGEAKAWLGQHLHRLHGEDVAQVLGALDSLQPPPAARCGVEGALIELLARQRGLSTACWLNTEASNRVRVNANLGPLDETVRQHLDQARGYTVIKLKVGIHPLEQELEWLQQLAAVVPHGVGLRLDANRAWSYPQARAFIEAIAPLPIESLEEPLARSDGEQLRQLQQGTAIPLALDESLAEFDLAALWQRPPVRRITLKPMVRGGLLPCMALAQQAYQAGMEVVVTTTVDSAVGVWAATSLASALGKQGEGVAHGLDTSRWLASDVAAPPEIRQGTITLSH
jgi:o-succinylbenzoate synthase